MEQKLKTILSRITGADRDAMADARRWQAMLAKPPGSLGKLEDIAVRLSGVTGSLHNQINRRRIVVLCADNGVIEEGVGSAPRTVTMAQAVNMTKHLTGMSSMAHAFGDEVQVVDLGIADEYDCPAILNRKIAEYTYAVLKDKPAFHISLAIDVSPNCDCWGKNDVPIVPDVGMFASFDPIALDQACADKVNAAPAMPESVAGCSCGGDHFAFIHPETCWAEQLTHGEKLGLGSREYTLVEV